LSGSDRRSTRRTSAAAGMVLLGWGVGAGLLRPDAAKIDHIRRNPQVALHFDGDGMGGDIVVMLGRAQQDDGAGRGQSPGVSREYAEGLRRIGMTVDQFSREYSSALRIHPSAIRGIRQADAGCRRQSAALRAAPRPPAGELGVLSMVAGIAMQAVRDKSWRAFGWQCLGWGAVDGAIAAAGLASASRPREAPAERRATGLRRLLLLQCRIGCALHHRGSHVDTLRSQPAVGGSNRQRRWDRGTGHLSAVLRPGARPFRPTAHEMTVLPDVPVFQGAAHLPFYRPEVDLPRF